jgi:alpha-glucosidase (family GH31 glycosyl hydrolase)
VVGLQRALKLRSRGEGVGGEVFNLRENLVPYTYTLAEQANRTGIPMVRPPYLQYPEQQDAYAQDGAEYLYGPDVLVAPVTTPGTTATTSVWFPPGSNWTDYFTGQTYTGGTTHDITTDLGSMPVYLKSGGIMTTRTDNVTSDVQNSLTKVTVTVAAGAAGHFSLYEDNGSSTNAAQSATTDIDYAEPDGNHQLHIAPAVGSFPGQVTQRAWAIEFRATNAPRTVLVDGVPAHAAQWVYAASTRTLTVTVPNRSVEQATVVSYR